ncbi:hypothetical protein CPB84DRAFT_1769014 [Gymnopilus junonius]|uniref:Protein kinase domain-containing protein n=1 Tax=Gymnopilus junonius TaxID=109634 RepID=A0A9P5TQV1_GYMJU|nr:hypothetical protein CPB84DRAFT_1769014 [Gymnopilus junonius]
MSKILEYCPLELVGGSISNLNGESMGRMLLLTEDDWFHASPSRNSGISSTATTERRKAVAIAESYDTNPINGEYQCLPLDLGLCLFDLSSGHIGRIVKGLLQQSAEEGDLLVMYKMVDVLRDRDAVAYAALRNLQGQVTYGFRSIWEILRVLVLPPAGRAIDENGCIDQELRNEMRLILQSIHDAGYVHGDIARCNFCRTESGGILLVNLGGVDVLKIHLS